MCKRVSDIKKQAEALRALELKRREIHKALHSILYCVYEELCERRMLRQKSLLPKSIELVRPITALGENQLTHFWVLENENYLRKCHHDPYGTWDATICFHDDTKVYRIQMTPRYLVRPTGSWSGYPSELFDLPFDSINGLFETVAESIIVMVAEKISELDPTGNACDRFQKTKNRLLAILSA